MEQKTATYKNFIDHLVGECHEGQGNVGPRRARSGVWNAAEDANMTLDERAANQLLERLSQEDRIVLASLLRETFVSGVFETLKALDSFQIPPFESGYEGSAYNDFVGRLNNWDWPRG